MAEGEGVAEAGVTMRVQSVIAGKINFASAQNDVAVVRKLSVENTGGEAVRNIRLTLTANPPILRDKTWIIDSIAPGTTIELGDLKGTLGWGCGSSPESSPAWCSPRPA